MKKYARLSEYGNLLVPVSLLEKILEQGYMVQTTYDSGKETIREIEPISSVKFHDEAEVRAALAQAALEE